MKTLRRLGLKTVGALLAIPRASLARRFRGETIGENVLMRLDEMMGVRDEPLNPLNPPTSFMAHRALMEPVIHAEGLEIVLGRPRQPALPRSRSAGQGCAAADPQAVPHRWLARQPAGGLFRAHP